MYLQHVNFLPHSKITEKYVRDVYKCKYMHSNAFTTCKFSTTLHCVTSDEEAFLSDSFATCKSPITLHCVTSRKRVRTVIFNVSINLNR